MSDNQTNLKIIVDIFNCMTSNEKKIKFLNQIIVNNIKYNNFEIIKFTIDNGLKFYMKKQILDMYLKNEHFLKIIKYLVEEKRLNIHEIYPDILITCAKNNHSEIVKYLIEKTNIVEYKKINILEHYIFDRNLEMIKYLVEKKVNFHKFNNYGLLFLAKNGNVEIIKYLVEIGRDFNKIGDYENINIFLYYVYNGCFGMTKYLIEKGADIYIKNNSALTHCITNNYFEIAKLLIENGANVNTSMDNGVSVLMGSIKKNNVKMTKFLIEKGANIHVNNNSPLKYCIIENNTEIMRILIQRGLNTYIKDSGLLICSIRCNNVQMVKLLIKSGMDFSLENNFALRYSLQECNIEMIKLLIESGASLDENEKTNNYSIDNLEIYEYFKNIQKNENNEKIKDFSLNEISLPKKKNEKTFKDLTERINMESQKYMETKGNSIKIDMNEFPNLKDNLKEYIEMFNKTSCDWKMELDKDNILVIS